MEGSRWFGDTKVCTTIGIRIWNNYVGNRYMEEETDSGNIDDL